ncbi:MAG: putative secretion ATPase [Bacillales bacterium]|jgi:pilus assembly protein CpaF|nr:putative secretion ATPase [Bacillales bacterium]
MYECEQYKLVTNLKKSVLDKLNLSNYSDDQLFEEIEKIVFNETKSSFLSINQKIDLVNRIFSQIRGFGLLDEILKDKEITEIMINGPDAIFVEKNGKLEKLDLSFESIQNLEDTIQKVVGRSGREVNLSQPIVDTRLPNGSRVNVVLPPIALNGPVMTVRKFSDTPMTFSQLIKYGSITEEIADFLEKIVKAKYNIFISGGTGSGKTTFLNALSNFIPKDERIITIEDSAELQITELKNLVRLETRNENSSGTGKVTIRDLIKSSLRMRPERIIVGEVRGEEAIDMLQAMNTGHDGSISTGHANSSKDMLSRLETMVLMGMEGLPIEAVRQQIASAIDIIIHLSRLRDKSRKALEITEIGISDGKYVLNKLFEFVEDQSSSLDKVCGKLKQTKNDLINKSKLENAGLNWGSTNCDF